MRIKRSAEFLLAVIMLFSMAGISEGTILNFQPSPTNLWNLDHSQYYVWGFTDAYMNGQIGGNTITAISLQFDDIYNWDASDPSKLYVYLLDNCATGTHAYGDSVGGNNPQFASGFTGISLITYETPDSDMDSSNDIPSGYSNRTDITYNFTQSEIDTFALYLANANSTGLGLDPDCHYNNSGITLSVTTAPVPEPATMLLLGTGLIGLAGYGRRKFKK